MASQSDLETNVIRDTQPCLPSSALLPLISNTVQGDIVHRTNAESRRGVDLKPTLIKTHSPKINMNNKLCTCRLECLFCGCLPRASDKSESQHTQRGHLSRPSKYITSRGVIPSSGSYNNNMQSELPATDSHEEEETPSSKDEEKSSPSLWSPFSRLRCYLAKRRRKNGVTTLDGLATVSDLISKDETVSKLSQTNDDLKDQRQTLLGPQKEFDRGKKCFIIDLDETLVHSSFKAVDKADFKVGVEIDNVVRQVYVLKRPHVDEFLRAMADIYECVLFTASLSKYADPVADFLDKWHVFRYRLFRESCVYHRGNYVKDLAQLGRPIEQVVILDNSPASYMFHAANAVQITSWFDDKTDKALLELIPYFQRLAEGDPGNVVEFLKNNPPPAQYAVVGSSDAGIIGPVGGPSGVLTRQTSDSRVNNIPFSSLALPSGVFPTLSPRNTGLPSDANPITSVSVDTDVGSSIKPQNAEDT